MDKATKRAAYLFAALLVPAFAVSAFRGTRLAGVAPARARVAAASEPAEPASSLVEDQPRTGFVPALASASRRLALIDGVSGRGNAADGPGLVGFWYIYSDGTGSVWPASGSQFSPSRCEGREAREFRGGGQTAWGAGFGVSLGARAGGGASWGATAPPFDAEAFEGVRFAAVSRKGPLAMTVSFSDVDTSPSGGVCDPKSSGPDQCHVDYGARVDFPGDGWGVMFVEFSRLELPPWSQNEAARKHGFVRSALDSMDFRLRPAAPNAPLAEFDVCVTELYFLRR